MSNGKSLQVTVSYIIYTNKSESAKHYPLYQSPKNGRTQPWHLGAMARPGIGLAMAGIDYRAGIVPAIGNAIIALYAS